LSQLSPQQQQVVNAFNKAASRYGASPKVRKALLEAGLVESGLRNLHYGDRDSLGALQERTSIYGAKQALNPYASAVRFIREAQPIAGKYARAGDLAQAVQRSAFPARYQQQSAAANQLLHASGRFPSASAGSKGAATRTIPGVNRSGERRSLLLNYLLGNSGGDLLSTVQQIAAVKNTPARTVRLKQPSSSTSTPKGGGGIGTFDGKPVQGWIVPILKQAQAAGWKGTVLSGVRSPQQQMVAAQHFGLQHYGPKGPLGSNHLPGRGAVDVSNPDGLAAALKRLGITSLKRAMANDPGHFSRTGY